MPDKIEEVTVYTFETAGLSFLAEGYVTKFDGFSIIYPLTEDAEKTMRLPLEAPLTLPLQNVTSKQNFAKPPSVSRKRKSSKRWKKTASAAHRRTPRPSRP
ncbi:MAG: hypothetical protein MZV49_05235 [Rhodopseudomonas palustris]|nr:hypothetical protein [Rhodopseudomonas palustris]